MVKNLPAVVGDTRDLGSFPGLGRYPGVRNGNPLLYPCLENSMERGAGLSSRVSQSRTLLSMCTRYQHTHTHTHKSLLLIKFEKLNLLISWCSKYEEKKEIFLKLSRKLNVTKSGISLI